MFKRSDETCQGVGHGGKLETGQGSDMRGQPAHHAQILGIWRWNDKAFVSLLLQPAHFFDFLRYSVVPPCPLTHSLSVEEQSPATRWWSPATASEHTRPLQGRTRWWAIGMHVGNAMYGRSTTMAADG